MYGHLYAKVLKCGVFCYCVEYIVLKSNTIYVSNCDVSSHLWSVNVLVFTCFVPYYYCNDVYKYILLAYMFAHHFSLQI